MNSKLVNTVSFHGTRKLRLMNKLNKHCSFRRGLLIDRACADLFKPVARSRRNY